MSRAQIQRFVPLTLQQVADDPTVATSVVSLTTGEKMVLRPIVAADVEPLAGFLKALSPHTRDFYGVDNDELGAAKERCGAINRYDKLCLVLCSESRKIILGIFDFSFGIPEGDRIRFANYGIELDEADYCRFGLCLSDNYQGKGTGSLVFPYLVEIARKFGKQHILLLGGVYADNDHAIRFYRKQGFRQLGHFKRHGDKEQIDMILEI
jgi:diamine N-acetyltransferase